MHLNVLCDGFGIEICTLVLCGMMVWGLEGVLSFLDALGGGRFSVVFGFVSIVLLLYCSNIIAVSVSGHLHFLKIDVLRVEGATTKTCDDTFLLRTRHFEDP